MLSSLISKFGKRGGAAANGAVGTAVDAYLTIPRFIIRGIQFIFALIVIGMYGNRVDNDRRAGNPQSAAWVFAVLVSSLSAITAVVFFLLSFISKAARFSQTLKKRVPKPAKLFAWDLLLFILWIAVFGTFAAIFLKRKEDKYQGTRTSIMKIGVWIDLINCIFWLITGIVGFVLTFVLEKMEKGTNKGIEKLEGKVDEVQLKAMDKVYQRGKGWDMV